LRLSNDAFPQGLEPRYRGVMGRSKSLSFLKKTLGVNEVLRSGVRGKSYERRGGRFKRFSL